MVRRTDALRNFEEADLPNRCRQVVSKYSPEVLKRALGCLYTRETRSTFEIEQIKPASTRTERFVKLLQMTEQNDFCRKEQLIDVQNRSVDARFRDSDYRSTQTYVGETVAWQSDRELRRHVTHSDLPRAEMEGADGCTLCGRQFRRHVVVLRGRE